MQVVSNFRPVKSDPENDIRRLNSYIDAHLSSDNIWGTATGGAVNLDLSGTG